MIKLYNTLSRSVEELQTKEPGKVGLYVCGMTVYDYSHIGHARAMMAFDVIVRHLQHRGYDVNYVRNHTDVDDKIIRRATELGEPALTVSNRYIQALDEDLDALGMLRPRVDPKVSEHIPDILALIGALVEKGHAYRTENGDVYYAVESFEGYGKLSGKKLEDQRAGERIAVGDIKRHPGDFALWKANAEPEIGWDSPWGRGRPGWHIECSGMARRYLGDTFDIHGGGIDLVFPHHENEIAQSEAATGHAPFARYWLHNGHLMLDGEKMSKSLGNIKRIRDIVAEMPAEALRLLYLGTHYRSPLPFNSGMLVESLAALDRIYLAKETVEEVVAKGGGVPLDQIGEDGREVHRLATAFADKFDAAMDEDFNAAGAVGYLFELVRAINRFGNDKKARNKGAIALAPALDAFALTGKVLGVGGMVSAAFFDEVKQKRLVAMGLSAADIDAKLAARTAARANKDFALADTLRAELDEAGVVVMDGPTGPVWRVRVS